ncbi:hypothetical protein CRE_13652 [Caenorhabditis remanei]|uniref:Receptor L-domain domain-containing protein n=1 Tax=Caenorhabditis remanei TaxID=31234 RepID=E3N1H5_CAERE|nr:hypothetical protein CRE_13652 [Caenorhabditis remanei]
MHLNFFEAKKADGPKFDKFDFRPGLSLIQIPVTSSYLVLTSEPECTFNHSEITSKTIEFFPLCKEVCGILVLNSNLDISEFHLEELFKPMQVLYGGIVIENTQLTSLSFFTINNFFGEFNFFCEAYGFFIRNNSQLTDISIVRKFYLWEDGVSSDACEFRVENNPRLNIEQFYSGVTRYLDIRSYGNLKEFGCRGDEITSSSLPFYQNCTVLFGGLKLYNLSDDFDPTQLSNVRKIIGPIDIQNTSLKDLSFLKDVDLVQISNVGLKGDGVTINIQNNLYMTKLGMPNMTLSYAWRGNRNANFQNLHPDFCLTIGEMNKLSDMKFVNIDAIYCDETEKVFGGKLCRSDDLEKCTYFWGDVIIESEEFDYLQKNLTHIFGKLVIQNTKTKNLKFFPQLTHIISLDSTSPAIQIVGNQDLKNAMFPKLQVRLFSWNPSDNCCFQSVVARSGVRVMIENNNPSLLNSSDALFPPPSARYIYTVGEYIEPPV